MTIEDAPQYLRFRCGDTLKAYGAGLATIEDGFEAICEFWRSVDLEEKANQALFARP